MNLQKPYQKPYMFDCMLKVLPPLQKLNPLAKIAIRAIDYLLTYKIS